jgi:hypothetical protein
VQNYIHDTLYRLAHPAGRAALFDVATVERILHTAYDVAALGVEGPYEPVFDEFRLGLWVPAGATDTAHGEASRDASPRGGDDALRVDALWRGSVVARVAERPPRPALVGGPLRRSEGDGPHRRALPVAAAVLVRDRGVSVGELVAESRLLRARLAALGVETTAERARALRHPLVVVCILPGVTPDVVGEPGAAARCAREGVVILPAGAEGARVATGGAQAPTGWRTSCCACA